MLSLLLSKLLLRSSWTSSYGSPFCEPLSLAKIIKHLLLSPSQTMSGDPDLYFASCSYLPFQTQNASCRIMICPSPSTSKTGSWSIVPSNVSVRVLPISKMWYHIHWYRWYPSTHSRPPSAMGHQYTPTIFLPQRFPGLPRVRISQTISVISLPFLPFWHRLRLLRDLYCPAIHLKKGTKNSSPFMPLETNLFHLQIPVSWLKL